MSTVVRRSKKISEKGSKTTSKNSKKGRIMSKEEYDRLTK
jgi:hypothetical protein